MPPTLMPALSPNFLGGWCVWQVVWPLSLRTFKVDWYPTRFRGEDNIVDRKFCTSFVVDLFNTWFRSKIFRFTIRTNVFQKKKRIRLSNILLRFRSKGFAWNFSGVSLAVRFAPPVEDNHASEDKCESNPRPINLTAYRTPSLCPLESREYPRFLHPHGPLLVSRPPILRPLLLFPRVSLLPLLSHREILR